MTPRERYFEMGMALSAIAHDMQERGVPISKPAQEQHRARLTKERDEAEALFMSLTGTSRTKKGNKEVSPCRQAAYLHRLFFEDFAVESRREYLNKDTGELTVCAQMLQDLVDERSGSKEAQVAAALLTFRKAAKYLESFIDNLPVHEDGRIHIPWNIYGARTMRWTAPILHQLPKKQEIILDDGSKRVTRQGLRDIVVAPPGWKIIECDKSQLELRIITLLTGDPPLVEAYARGANVHSENAQTLLGRITGMARDVAKTFVFCDIYGGEPETSWKQMTPKFPSLSNAKGKALIRQCSERWRLAHPVIERYKEEQWQLARHRGYTDLPVSGLRIEYHPAANGQFRVDRTKVINTRVQHTGSDIINPETIRVSAGCKNGAWVFAMVHDALFVICRDEDVPYHAEMMMREMVTEVEYRGRKMLFGSETKVGQDWGNLAPYERAA